MSDYFDRIERQLVARVEAGPGRRVGRQRPSPGRWRGRLVPAVAIAIATVVVAVVLAVSHSGSRRQTGGTTVGNSTLIVLRAPADTSTQTLIRTVRILRRRLAAGQGLHPQIAVHGHEIVVRGLPAGHFLVGELIQPGQLTWYDWEASVLLPSGKVDASQLTARRADALALSQGAGLARDGGVSLYRAVRLAARQPAVVGASGHELYLFGPHGSAACRQVYRQYGTTRRSFPGRCLIVGPVASESQLVAELPHGVSVSDGRRLVVPAGVTVLQAADQASVISGSPVARFFVLRGRGSAPQLIGAGAARDSGGEWAVRVSLSPGARLAFQRLTAVVAHRGARVSVGASRYFQHFAVAVDGRLITVPQIDFTQYPDGVVALDGEIDLSGGFTHQSARQLGAVLAAGPLPTPLSPVAGGS